MDKENCNNVKNMTLEEAMELYKVGFRLLVNDGEVIDMVHER